MRLCNSLRARRPIGAALAGALALVLCGCGSGTHMVGYAIDPLDGPPLKFQTPVLVRPFEDRRPYDECYEPDSAGELYQFYSSDKQFKEPPAPAVKRAFELELANAGVEVADEGNHLLGQKPYLRVTGELLHFLVTRADVPVPTLQNKVNTLWRREQYSVRVGLRITMIDTKSEKKVMQRVYSSNDSFTQRSSMIDVKQYEQDATRSIDKAKWTVAGDDYCIQLLNKHLKIVLVQARTDITTLLTP
ncbi:MAG: hypothetical protein NTV22_14610 [bacterium]|nr:hypothetical protein [bacterium]